MSGLLTPDFYRQDAVTVAKGLLGCTLSRKIGDRIITGKIIETEAYLQDDPACHAFNGITPRTKPMFEAGGISYVYLIYGMHFCFNVVTGEVGVGEAVLIRALDIAGCEGPGKLCKTLGIGKEDNGQCLQTGAIQILEREKEVEFEATPRIGISKGQHLHYRFCAFFV